MQAVELTTGASLEEKKSKEHTPQKMNGLRALRILSHTEHHSTASTIHSLLSRSPFDLSNSSTAISDARLRFQYTKIRRRLMPSASDCQQLGS